ncbi:MAG: hypothetical protein ABR591_15270 [Candidatus Velthaea sp.]
MRAVTIALAVAAILAGGMQLAATAFYGDLAQPPAVPRLVPPALGIALARPLGELPFPAVVRAAYARALLHRGDAAGAQRIIDRLPPIADRFEVAGMIAEQRGDFDGAAQEYLQARDVEHAQALADELDRAGRLDDALTLQRALVERSTGLVDAENHARALWRLGQLLQERAASASAAARRPLERESMRAYDAALALAPSDETFLLAAGQQSLTLGDRTAAERYYRRALDAVPNSADAKRGLERLRHR